MDKVNGIEIAEPKKSLSGNQLLLAQIEKSPSEYKRILDQQGYNKVTAFESFIPMAGSVVAPLVSSVGNLVENALYFDEFKQSMKAKYKDKGAGETSIGVFRDVFAHDSTKDITDVVADKFINYRKRFEKNEIAVRGQTTGSAISTFGVDIAPYFIGASKIGTMRNTRNALASGASNVERAAAVSKDAIHNAITFAGQEAIVSGALQKPEGEILMNMALGGAVGGLGTKLVGAPAMEGAHEISKLFGGTGVKAGGNSMLEKASAGLKAGAIDLVETGFNKLEKSPFFSPVSYVVPNKNESAGRTAYNNMNYKSQLESVSDKTRTTDRTIGLQNIESPVVNPGRELEATADSIPTPAKPRLTQSFYDTGGRQYAENYMLSHHGKDTSKLTISRARFEEGKHDQYAKDALEAYDVVAKNKDVYGSGEAKIKNIEPKTSTELAYDRYSFEAKLYNDIAKKLNGKHPDKSIYRGKAIEAEYRRSLLPEVDKDELTDAVGSAITKEDLNIGKPLDYADEMESRVNFLRSKRFGKKTDEMGNTPEFAKEHGLFRFSEPFTKAIGDVAKQSDMEFGDVARRALTKTISEKMNKVEYLKSAKQLETKVVKDGGTFDINNISDDIKLKYPDDYKAIASYRNRMYDMQLAKDGKIDANELAWREGQRISEDFGSGKLNGSHTSANSANDFVQARAKAYSDIGMKVPDMTTKQIKSGEFKVKDIEPDDFSKELIHKRKALDLYINTGELIRYSGSAKRPGQHILTLSEKRDVDAYRNLLKTNPEARQIFTDRYMPEGTTIDNRAKIKGEANTKWNELVRKQSDARLGFSKADKPTIKKIRAKESEIDAKNSVAAIVGALSGDKHLINSVLTKGKNVEFRDKMASDIGSVSNRYFEKLKGSAITKDDVKVVYTPKTYGSMDKGAAENALAELPWLKTIDNANLFVAEHNISLNKHAPELKAFMDKIADIHSKSKTGEYSWTLPDGYKVDISLKNKDIYVIRENGKNVGTFSTVGNSSDEFSRALMPRLIHSIEGWMSREIRKKHSITTNHDALFTPKGMEKEVEQTYRDLLSKINESKLADKLIKEIGGEGYNVKDSSKMFQDKARKVVSTEHKAGDIISVDKKTYSELPASKAMNDTEAMIEFMTTHSHRDFEYHTVVDGMIEEAVHSKTDMSKARSKDDVFERALALALNGVKPTKTLMIKPPKGLTEAGNKTWYEAQLSLYDKFRASAEFNPFLKVKGDRKYFDEKGNIIGSKLADIRAIRELEHNNIINAKRADDIEREMDDVSSMDSSTLKDNLDELAKKQQVADDFANAKSDEKVKEATEKAKDREYSRLKPIVEAIDKVLEPLGLSVAKIGEHIKKGLKYSGIKLRKLWRALSPYFDKMKGMDTKFYNHMDEFMDNLADKYPKFESARDTWRESKFVDPLLKSMKENVGNAGSKLFNKAKGFMSEDTKKAMDAFIDKSSTLLKDASDHITDKYSMNKEYRQFSKLLGMTAPAMRMAEEAGDHLTKAYIKAVPKEMHEDILNHIFYTDFRLLYDNMIDTKQAADEFMSYPAAKEAYARAQKWIDASAAGIGRRENQRGYYANNAGVIAKHINMPMHEDTIDILISIKAMEQNGSWKFVEEGLRDTASGKQQAILSSMDIARAHATRSKILFAGDNELHLMQKGYIQDSYDISKVYNNGKLEHNTERGFQSGALGRDTMSNKVGSAVPVDVLNESGIVADAWHIAEQNGWKLSDSGYRKVADLKTMQDMGLKRDLPIMLGNTEASLRRKEAQIETFTYILSHEDSEFGALFSKDMKEGFVELTNEEMLRMPRIARDAIRFVNPKYRDKLMGRNHIGVSADASYGIRVADTLLRETVSLFKQSNVLKSLSSFKNATIVPYTFYILAHGNPIDAFKYSKQGIKAYRDFVTITEKYDIAKATGKMTKELEDEYNSNEVVNMLRNGLSINTLDGVRSNGSLMNNFLSELTGGKLDNITNNIMFNQNSITGGAAKGAFSFLDFEGRYMMYHGYKKANPNADERYIMARVNDIFGQMDEIAPPLIDAIDKYGLAVFAKWATSVLPAVARTVKHNPVKATALTLGLMYLSDESDTHLAPVSPTETLVDMPVDYLSLDSTFNVAIDPTKIIPSIYRTAYQQGSYYMDDNPIGEAPALLFKDRIIPFVNKEGELIDHRGTAQKLYDYVVYPNDDGEK